MSFGCRKLTTTIKNFTSTQRYAFEYLASGLEYSYQLKFLAQFKEFLTLEAHRAQTELKNLETSRQQNGSLTPLTESQKKFVLLTSLDKRIQQKFFSEENRHWWFVGISNERRIKLGINDHFFDYISYMETLNDRTGIRELYLKDLKEHLRKNKLKTWGEMCGFLRRYANRSELVEYNYHTHWESILNLNGSSFEFEGSKYLIYFPKTNHELMDYGAQFNTCLASCQAFKFVVGEEIKLIVFKNKVLFSSLTLEKKENEIKVVMMRTYNNEEIDLRLWPLAQELVNKENVCLK